MKLYHLTLLLLLISIPISAQLSESNSEILRQQLFEQINTLRISQELRPLELDIKLRKAAKIQSNYMAAKKKLTHDQMKFEFANPMKRVKYFEGVEFEMVGENVLQSAPVRMPLREQQLILLAKEMFLSWKNSPGHYANMVHPDYEYGDLDFQFDPTNKVIYAAHVFGKKGVKINGQLSDNAFGLTEDEKDCSSTYSSFSNIIANVGNAVHIEGNDVVFYYHNLEYFHRIFQNDTDGIAIDIISRDQLPCDGSNQLDYSPIYDGILLQPIYKSEILKNNTAESDYRIISKIGTIPDSLSQKDISASVILIKDRKKCTYLFSGHVPRKYYKLRPIAPKLINPNHRTLANEGIIESQELNYNFNTDITRPNQYPEIKKSSHQIHSVEIISFSSVEGDEMKNEKLHHQRAQAIKQHILSKTKTKDSKITIDARENWDKMYFQLKYYFKDHLAELSKLELKEMLASDMNAAGLPWDSLLFAQRQSKATINYFGQFPDTISLEEKVQANLRMAILKKDFELANKCLFDMYNSDFSLSNLGKESFIFKALQEHPELVQNAAALFSKSYRDDQHRTTEFLYSWISQIEKCSPDAIYNLLHLHSLLSQDLMDVWDLPAQRLSNVLHPKTIIPLTEDISDNELMLNLHLTFLSYFGQINDGANITRSFNFIADYFKSRSLDIEDQKDLALFFNNWSMYQMTMEFLYPKYKEGTLDEDAVFILLQTMSFYKKAIGLYDSNGVSEKASELNIERWCSWLNGEFQLLRKKEIKDIFCARCQ